MPKVTAHSLFPRPTMHCIAHALHRRLRHIDCNAQIRLKNSNAYLTTLHQPKLKNSVAAAKQFQTSLHSENPHNCRRASIQTCSQNASVGTCPKLPSERKFVFLAPELIQTVRAANWCIRYYHSKLGAYLLFKNSGRRQPQRGFRNGRLQTHSQE